MSTLQDNYVIRSKRQMRSLAASTRQEIVDVLPGMGTVSVAELATALGRPADALYYHLRILKRVGLVLGVGHRKLNGRREALFRAVAPEMSLCYELGKKGNGSEVNAIIASMLRLGIRDFRNSIAAGEARVSGPKRELWALRKTGWLSLDQVAEANRQIQRLMQVVKKPGRNGRLYGITVVLTPLDRWYHRPS
ncbi:MAG TPA: helix-turn-helix domain-containing protein [Candidatus Sulfotelmatobacter sp.]|jgi:predicted ArsR family transcriptional regulator|nr:helix-turn-helix domain-containing protein [Candidatus Sulfotelmatobacter sp.]